MKLTSHFEILGTLSFATKHVSQLNSFLVQLACVMLLSLAAPGILYAILIIPQ